MDRIVGIETEYGCLLSEEEPHVNSELWPAKVKNYLFRKADAGTIDLHYRDYEEPPGNGGFLLNGGRLYLDMGHIEYASPEYLHLHDVVTYELAGDDLLQSSLVALGAEDRVSFIKNNVDHHTGATFGCHENYLMKREGQFTPPILGTLLTFLATRQIFTGAGRVGQSNPLAFDFEPPKPEAEVNFQLSQRADHIVNDIYQWVQFNRAIINARDEPLADYRKYRRVPLLIGDSNMSPFLTALKIGTTVCILTLLEENLMPDSIALRDAVLATREISRNPDGHWLVEMDDGSTQDALDIQYQFLEQAHRYLHGSDDETDWILEIWGFTLDALKRKPDLLMGGVDWISKRWLLNMFIEDQGLSWQDPWIQSLDLEYHNIHPERGLFFALKPAKTIGEFNASVRRQETKYTAPSNTRAAGRSRAVALFQKKNLPYIINWDSIALESQDYLSMPDPFKTYSDAVDIFLK